MAIVGVPLYLRPAPKRNRVGGCFAGGCAFVLRSAGRLAEAWGSTLGALREAVDMAALHGLGVNLVHFAEIWPFPVEAADLALQGARRIIAVESNATAQFAQVLQAETGHRVSGTILKFDGRPLKPAYILAQLGKEVA